MRTFSLLCVAAVVLLLIAAPAALAQGTPGNVNPTGYTGDRAAESFYGNAIAAGLGAALTIIGAGWGFGRIGSAALESMARQPEVAPRIQTAMLIIAALLEGATFFSLIVCIIMANKA